MDFVSVIVPIYNVEQYLERCIDSILRQTYSEFELILVDDGSPDRCPEICDFVSKKDSRIKVIHKKNGGLSDARNAGIAQAKGNLLVFVDSDDVLAENGLEVLVQAYKATGAQFVSTDRFNTFSSEIPDNKVKISSEYCVLSPAQSLEHIFCKTGRWEAWGNMYAKELFGKEKFPVGSLYEDLALIPLLIMKCQKCAFINTSIYYYYIRNDSIMGKSKSVIKDDLAKICEMIINRITSELSMSKELNNIVTGILMELASRIDLGLNNYENNKRFIALGRKCIFHNLKYILKSNRYPFKRKFYCISYALYLDCVWRPIYHALKK